MKWHLTIWYDIFYIQLYRMSGVIVYLCYYDSFYGDSVTEPP